MREGQVFVPDGTSADAAIARTTHMAIGAHPDDVPIMAYHGIAECYRRSDRWFLAVTATDGAGSPRSGPYAEITDAEMTTIRADEERAAAVVGEYTAVQLGHSSAEAKDPGDETLIEELADLLGRARPGVLYLHNLADRHDTHVAVALRSIAAVRRLPAETRPARVYGCEVWRGLDWLVGDDAVALAAGARPHLAAALIGVYDSQVSGGKRYDLATAGRWLANATFAESHQVDASTAITHAMDLTPLTADPGLDPAEYVAARIERLAADVVERLRRV